MSLIPKVTSADSSYLYDGHALWRRSSIQNIQPISEESKELCALPQENNSWVYLFGREEPIVSRLTVDEWSTLLGFPIPKERRIKRNGEDLQGDQSRKTEPVGQRQRRTAADAWEYK